MTGSHEHSTKTVVVSYSEDEWEVWSLRFNRGNKRNKPVKFFASREWQSGTAGPSFSGTHTDLASEREAEAWFAASIAEHGGIVRRATPELLRRANALGYAAT
jgi:hypothetical protein